MLKTLMASALILTSSLSAVAPASAQIQQPLEGTNNQVLVASIRYRRTSTRDRHGYVHLRSGPSLGYRVKSIVPKNADLTILNAYNGWYKVDCVLLTLNYQQ